MEAWRPAAERNRQKRAALREEARRLAHSLAAVGAERVVLFGSTAREDGGPVDDIDLLVVLPTSVPFVERAPWLLRILDSREGVDVLAYTPAEFARMREQSGFVRNVLAKGIVLHEKHSGP